VEKVAPALTIPQRIKQHVLRFLRNRQQAYQTTFLNPVGERVLQDLAKFCRATESTFHPDPRMSAILEGRREVWLRIQHHLQLTDDQLWEIYGKNLNQ